MYFISDLFFLLYYVQEYDPDLPPELAAAAGIQDTPSESLKVGKPDAVQNDLGRVHARVRPPLVCSFLRPFALLLVKHFDHFIKFMLLFYF